MNLDMVGTEDTQRSVEANSKTISDIVDSIIKPYSEDLDRYVLFIKDCLISFIRLTIKVTLCKLAILKPKISFALNKCLK